MKTLFAYVIMNREFCNKNGLEYCLEGLDGRTSISNTYTRVEEIEFIYPFVRFRCVSGTRNIHLTVPCEGIRGIVEFENEEALEANLLSIQKQDDLAYD